MRPHPVLCLFSSKIIKSTSNDIISSCCDFLWSKMSWNWPIWTIFLLSRVAAVCALFELLKSVEECCWIDLDADDVDEDDLTEWWWISSICWWYSWVWIIIMLTVSWLWYPFKQHLFHHQTVITRPCEHDVVLWWSKISFTSLYLIKCCWNYCSHEIC